MFDGNSFIEVNQETLGDNFRYKLKLSKLADVTTEQWVVSSWDDTSNNRSTAIRIRQGQLQTYFSQDGASTSVGSVISIQTDQSYSIEYGKRGGDAFISLNGGAENITPVFAGDVFVPSVKSTYGAKNVSNRPSKLIAGIESIELYIDEILVNKWDSGASNSGNTGQQPVWTDTVGNNDGVGFGFPTNGTAFAQQVGGNYTATALIFDRNYAEFSTPLNLSVGEFYEFRAKWIDNGTTYQMPLGIYRADPGDDFLSFNTGGKIQARVNNVSYSSPDSYLTSGETYTGRLTRTPTGYEFSIDSNLVLAIDQNVDLDELRELGTPSQYGYFTGEMEYFIKSDGFSEVERLDPSASYDGLGIPVFKNILTSNDATGVGMPTNGDAWRQPPPSGSALSIDLKNYTSRRDGAFQINGIYGGNPTGIKYKINNGDWVLGEENPANNVFSFDVSIPYGESNLTLSFENDESVVSTVILVKPYVTIATAGQSNISCRGTNNQTYEQLNGVKAYLFGNDDEYKLLEDPYDSSVGQVDGVSADSIAGGSWLVRFAHHWIQNQNTPLTVVPCPKGGTSISSWLKGGSLYTSLSRRINSIGGVDVVFWQQGETDAGSGTTLQDYEDRLNQFVNDVFNDFGCETFIIPLHTITTSGYGGDGVTTGQNAIRDAQLNVADTNPNARISQPITDIDISDQDGVHFKADDELDLLGSRAYESFVGNVSDLIITVSNIPDGSYEIVLTDPDDKSVNIYDGTASFVNETFTLPSLGKNVGTEITGYLLGNGDPQTKGIVIRGTTA